MDAWQFIVLVVSSIIAVWVVGRAYSHSVKIQEEGKYRRSLANAQERTAQQKIQGLFEVKLAELETKGSSESEGELKQLMKIFTVGKTAEREVQQHGLSWETMKQQLQNPEIKKIILENKEEVLKILQS